MDEGAYTDLRAMHDELNEAIAAAYGWPASISHDGDEIVHRLLELNREIAAGTRTYDPFGAQAWAAQELLLRRERSRRGNRGDLPVPPRRLSTGTLYNPLPSLDQTVKLCYTVCKAVTPIGGDAREGVHLWVESLNQMKGSQ